MNNHADKFQQIYNQANRQVRCQEMKKFLEALGFKIEDGKKQGHKKVKHTWLSEHHDFRGSNYTCGHGANSELLKNYPKSMAKLVKRYEAELKNYLTEENTQ